MSHIYHDLYKDIIEEKGSRFGACRSDPVPIGITIHAPHRNSSAWSIHSLLCLLLELTLFSWSQITVPVSQNSVEKENADELCS